MSLPVLQLYNTMTRAIAPLQPIAPPRVSLYVCGPTIYNFGHIGNFRTYLAVDLLRRTLKQFGYSVEHVMQFTDVDDKTIRGARESGVPLREFTAEFRRAFLEDAQTLQIEMPEKMPNATEHIPAMISLIEKLITRGSAYASDDGSVYFRIAAFPRYGCLGHLDLSGLISGARVNQDEYEKEGVGDFVLWKKWVSADGEVGWESPWGRGRPGWHIECSALSMGFLGPEIDLHGGGVDLRFPHHENEIAQSESATGETFVRAWFHVEHLLVDGQKMSKALGNFFTVRDVLHRGYTGRELRYALLSGAHYRKNLNFTWQGMEDARAALLRLDDWRKRVQRAAGEKPLLVAIEPTALSRDFLEEMQNALADDLNLAGALGSLFNLIRETNKAFDAGQIKAEEAQELLQAWGKFDAILGLGEAVQILPEEVRLLLEERAAVRLAKNFQLSDSLRDKIAALGWRVKDTPQGQEVHRQD